MLTAIPSWTALAALAALTMMPTALAEVPNDAEVGQAKTTPPPTLKRDSLDVNGLLDELGQVVAQASTQIPAQYWQCMGLALESSSVSSCSDYYSTCSSFEAQASSNVPLYCVTANDPHPAKAEASGSAAADAGSWGVFVNANATAVSAAFAGSATMTGTGSGSSSSSFNATTASEGKANAAANVNEGDASQPIPARAVLPSLCIALIGVVAYPALFL